MSVDCEEIDTGTSYKLLGALITNDGYSKDEIKGRISLGKAAMAILSWIIRDSEVATNTQVKLVQSSQRYSMDVKAVRSGTKGS